MKVLVCGQDPANPGGMAKYIGALQTYLCDQRSIEPIYLNETQVKGRTGMTSANPRAALAESVRLLAVYNRTLRNTRPQVVHLHMAYGTSVLEKGLMAKMASRRGIPALVHLHGSRSDVEIPRWSSRKKRWLSKAFASPNRIIALTERMAALVRDALPSVDVTVLPNAIDLIDPPPPLRLDPPTFGFIGFLDRRKGELDLIEALALMQDRPWNARIAGNGSAFQEAQDLAAARGVAARIEFLGFVSGENKEDFFRSIDLLCLPSHAENMPISLLEAMAYGRPVVATDVGGVPELVKNGVHGLLVPAHEPKELKNALVTMIDSEQKLQQMGEAAWTHIRNEYTWEVVGPRLTQLYHTAAGRII